MPSSDTTLRKTIVRGHDLFGGDGHLATKINLTSFVGIEVSNIFHLTFFSEKKKNSKIIAKNNFGARDYF